uniref:protein-tyrosine-phosphatase n=1 Tax=Sinocyclocheilus grahami TaxID=75366 RepID=A0A672R7L2_SINGR
MMKCFHNPHPFALRLQIPLHPSHPHPLLLAHLLSPNPNSERGRGDTPYRLQSRSTWSSTHSTENVHCQAGVSRSATIVIAYLMKHTLMTMTDAYKYVRGRRPIVSPNLNFMGQLLEFERDLNSGLTPRILTPKLSGLETQV